MGENMIEKFEENDDVTNVFTNLLMDDETMNALEEQVILTDA